MTSPTTRRGTCGTCTPTGSTCPLHMPIQLMPMQLATPAEFVFVVRPLSTQTSDGAAPYKPDPTYLPQQQLPLHLACRRFIFHAFFNLWLLTQPCRSFSKLFLSMRIVSRNCSAQRSDAELFQHVRSEIFVWQHGDCEADISAWHL